MKEITNPVTNHSYSIISVHIIRMIIIDIILVFDTLVIQIYMILENTMVYQEAYVSKFSGKNPTIFKIYNVGIIICSSLSSLIVLT